MRFYFVRAFRVGCRLGELLPPPAGPIATIPSLRLTCHDSTTFVTTGHAHFFSSIENFVAPASARDSTDELTLAPENAVTNTDAPPVLAFEPHIVSPLPTVGTSDQTAPLQSSGLSYSQTRNRFATTAGTPQPTSERLPPHFLHRRPFVSARRFMVLGP